MDARQEPSMGTFGEEHKSGLRASPKAAEQLDLCSGRLGQSCPQHCPQVAAANSLSYARDDDPLGEPLNINQVAALLGCSAWTVRQRHLPSGLPYFRTGPTGKLMFYRNQVVHWVLHKQRQKGGEIR